MEVLKRLGFTRYEGLLGVCVLALGLLVFIPPLRGNFMPDKEIRSSVAAQTIAHAVLDYHTDTGQWPAHNGQTRDLSCLTQEMERAGESVAEAQMIGTMVQPSGQASAKTQRIAPWLKDVPLDSWGRPYRVVVVESKATEKQQSQAPTDRQAISGYPTSPPTGTTIIVYSAGANGIWDTNPVVWRSQPFTKLRVVANEIFAGDDVGFVLPNLNEGES